MVIVAWTRPHSQHQPPLEIGGAVARGGRTEATPQTTVRTLAKEHDVGIIAYVQAR